MDGDVPKTTEAAKHKVPFEQRFVDKRHANRSARTTVETLFWQDVQQIGANVLKGASKTGTPTKSELALSIQNGKFQGDDSLVVSAIYKNFNKITGKGSFGLGEAKVSTNDLANLASIGVPTSKEFKSLRSLDEWCEAGNLDRFSPDKSGTLSILDLSSALKQANLSSQEKAMLSQLNANFKSIASGAGKIGKKEVQNYFDKFTNTPDFMLPDAFLRDMHLIENTQQSAESHRLFADQNNPLMSIKPDSVVQGFSGDCAFKAALAGLAVARPAEILTLVKANASGKFDVQLPGTKEKSFSISKPTDEELGLFSRAQNPGGFWPAVLTKAFGESVYNQSNFMAKSKMNSETEDEWAGENGSTRKAMIALTGHKVDMLNIGELTDSDLTQRMLKGQKENRIIVLGTPPANDHHTTPDGFHSGHVFTVTDMRNSNGKFELTVRDPQGHGMNQPDGTMKISLECLKKNFDSLYIETKNPS